MSLRSGTRLGGWVVDHVLHYGEPAVVAAHRDDDRSSRAVLEVSEASSSASARQQRVVRALQSLDHPRIPKVLDARDEAGRLVLALRAFTADALADRMVSGVPEWRQALVWLFELATTLQHVHAAGWVHRNVNPETVFVAPRHQLWLLGFEHAVPNGERTPLDEVPDAAMAYLAPEVLRDPDHDPVRADLYAFGLVAYELLTGEKAFPAAAWAQRADRKRTLLEWKTRARELDPGPEQPAWLRNLIRKCTHPIPEQRLPDFDTVLAMLTAARPSWELPELEATPVAVPRGGLPPLQVESSLLHHQEQMALWRRAQLEQRAANRTVMVFVAAALGSVGGIAMSALVILLTELAKLG